MPGVHLRRADLSSALLQETQLQGACLADSAMILTNLRRADLSGADLSRSVMLGAILLETTLHDARLDGANLVGANLVGADMARVQAINADFQSIVTGTGQCDGGECPTNFGEGVWDGASFIGVIFTNSDLSDGDFIGADLRNSQFVGASFAGASFEQANMENANLNGAELQGVGMVGTNLGNAFLSNADLSSVDLTGANLNGGLLSRTKMFGVVLDDASLTGTNLTFAYYDVETVWPQGFEEGLVADLYKIEPNAQLGDAQLAGARLSGVDLSGAVLVGANLSDARLDGAQLSAVDFSRAQLVRASLVDVQADGARFERSVLSGARLDGSSFNGGSFDFAALAGASFLGCGLTQASLIGVTANGADFTDCVMNGVDLSQGAELVDARFVRAEMANADLSGGLGSRATFEDTTMSGANLQDGVWDSVAFRGAELVGADFRGSALALADFTDASLIRAEFPDTLPDSVVWSNTTCPDETHSDLDNGGTCIGHLDQGLCLVGPGVVCPNVDFREQNNLFRANLEGAVLNGANLEEVNLTEANLVGANLSGAVLRFTDFSGADLSGADVSDADITGAVWSNTTCPDGTNSDDNGETCLGHFYIGDACPVAPESGPLRPGLVCVGADFSSADLRGVDLSGADLTEALFFNADLKGAQLVGTVLLRADMTSADLVGADLYGAVLEGLVWSNTMCPDGTNSNDNGGTCLGHLYIGGLCDVGPGTDCSGVDLSSADLRFAELNEALLVGASLDDALLQRAQLAMGELSNAILDGANMEGADLYKAVLEGVQWSNTVCPDGTNSDGHEGTCLGHLYGGGACDIAPGTNCDDAQLVRAELRRADLQGASAISAVLNNANLPESRWTDAVLLDAQMDGAVMVGAVFQNANLRGASLRDVVASGADFRGANLNQVNASGADLRGANLRGANLSEMVWSSTMCPDGTNSDDNEGTCLGHLYIGDACVIGPGAQCPGADLSSADLRGADLSGANLTGANLSQALLDSANLTDAVLRDALMDNVTASRTIFMRAQMQNSQLSQADLSDSDLRGARLSQAVMSDAVLVRAQTLGSVLSGVVWSSTLCPDGTDSDDHEGTCLGYLYGGNACVFAPGGDCTGAELVSADLRSVVLQSMTLNGAVMSFCDLSGANIADTNLINASMNGCVLDGVSWDNVICPDGTNSNDHAGTCEGHFFRTDDCALEPGVDCPNVSLIGADLRGRDLTGANLSGADLTNADLTGVSLRGAVVLGIVWSGTVCPDGTNSDDNNGTCIGHLYTGGKCSIEPQVECEEADLSNADLRGAQLQGALLEAVDLTGADLAGANLSGANLRHAWVRENVWSGTVCPDGTNSDDNGGTCWGHLFTDIPCPDFQSDDCQGANLTLMDFRGVDLGTVDLSNADLRLADLRGTDVSQALLTDAQLLGARFDETTAWPDGFNIAEHNMIGPGVSIQPRVIVDAERTFRGDLFHAPFDLRNINLVDAVVDSVGNAVFVRALKSSFERSSISTLGSISFVYSRVFDSDVSLFFDENFTVGYLVAVGSFFERVDMFGEDSPGGAPVFEEPMWNSYFVNTSLLDVGFYDRVDGEFVVGVFDGINDELTGVTCMNGVLSSLNNDSCAGQMYSGGGCLLRDGVSCAQQNISNVDWSMGRFEQVDLSGSQISGEFWDAQFVNANLSNVRWSGKSSLAPYSIHFQSVDLSDAEFVNINLLGTQFDECNLEGVVWSAVTCPDGTQSSDNGNTCIGHLEPASPCNMALDAVNCAGANLSGLELGDYLIEHSNFDGSDLSFSSFGLVSGFGRNIRRHRLFGVDLTGAVLTDQTRDTRIFASQVEGVNLMVACPFIVGSHGKPASDCIVY